MTAAARLLAPDAAALAFFALLAVVHSRVWDRAATDLYAHVDPLQDAWVLSSVTDNVWRRPWDLFEGNNYYPSRDAVLFCDPLLLPAVLVAPLRVLTDSPAALYNAAVLAVLTLSGYGFWRLALELSGDRRAALLAGVAIPYTSQLLSHLYQLNLLTSAGYPALLLGLLRLLERPSWPAAVLTGVAFALQAGTSGYHAFACTFLCLVVAAWGWRQMLESRTLGLVAAALLAPYLVRHLGHRGEAELARPLHWAQAWSVDLPWGLLSSHTYVWRALMPDHGLPIWPGAVVLALGLAGAWRDRSPRARLLVLIAGVFLLLALGPELRVFGSPLAPLPYMVLYKYLPLFGAARRAGFFIVPAMMALGLLAVLGLRSFAAGRRPAVVYGVVLAAAVESFGPAMPRRDPGGVLPDVYTFLRGQPRGGILELPAEDDDNQRHQWWSTRHHLPIANGVAAFEPRWSRSLHQLIRREWKQRPPSQDASGWTSTSFLQSLPIRYLVMHPGVSGYWQSHVDATPSVFRPLYTAAGGERVYAVRRGASLDRPVRRRFRDDELPLRVSFRSAQAAAVTVVLDDGTRRAVSVGAGESDVEVSLPRGSITRGLNTLTLEPAAGVELVDVVPAGS